MFSSHHADGFTSEQVVDKFGNERTKERKKEKTQKHKLHEPLTMAKGQDNNVCVLTVLCELDAELREVFAC